MAAVIIIEDIWSVCEDCPRQRILLVLKENKMAVSKVFKRARIGSDEAETACQKCTKIIQENIACFGCKLRYCLKCAKKKPNKKQTHTKKTKTKKKQQQQQQKKLFTIVSCPVKWTNLCGLVPAAKQLFLLYKIFQVH